MGDCNNQCTWASVALLYHSNYSAVTVYCDLAYTFHIVLVDKEEVQCFIRL